MRKIIYLGVVITLILGLVIYLLLALFFTPNERDNKRKNFGTKIVQGIESFKQDFGRYPPRVDFSENSYLINPGIKGELKDFYRYAEETNPEFTHYKYYYFQGGFAFCIGLETGGYFDLGTFTCEEIENLNK
ncbi:MAG: hypothetical protein Kow0081_2270 [Candidatus Dojkabacteria bacterium]